MGRNWDKIMFDNIGEKIKKVAKAIAWFEITLSIIGGIVMFFAALVNFQYLWYLMFLAPVSVAIGCIAAWLSVIVLYAFGELVEKMNRIDEKLSVISKPFIEEQNRAKREAEERAKREAQERERLRAENRANREDEARARREASRTPRPVVQEPETTLAEKLSYALEYRTDEGMINYLSQIEDEMVAKILKEPKHLIRGLVEQALKEQ